MITTHIIAALATITSLTAALPSSKHAPTLSLAPRQDTSNCTEYVSPSAGYTTICHPSDCTATYLVEVGDSCQSVQEKFGNFTTSILRYWNPDLGPYCFGIQAYVPICINTEWYQYDPAEEYAPKSIVSTDGLNPTLQPVPWLYAVTETCNRYYLVAPEQTIGEIADDAGITFQQMLDWNIYLNPTGENLWQDYWVCVGVSA